RQYRRKLRRVFGVDGPTGARPCHSGGSKQHPRRDRRAMLIEMFIKGLMVDPITNLPIVILRDADNQRVLPIWVGPVEANAIALQIENVVCPRPMTHDLLKNLLIELGAELRRVIIADLRDNTFYAYLELHRGGEVTLVDARPS